MKSEAALIKAAAKILEQADTEENKKFAIGMIEQVLRRIKTKEVERENK